MPLVRRDPPHPTESTTASEPDRAEASHDLGLALGGEKDLCETSPQWVEI